MTAYLLKEHLVGHCSGRPDTVHIITALDEINRRRLPCFHKQLSSPHRFGVWRIVGISPYLPVVDGDHVISSLTRQPTMRAIWRLFLNQTSYIMPRPEWKLRIHLRGWLDESWACTMPVGSMRTNLFEQSICNCWTDSCSTPYAMLNITTWNEEEDAAD